MLGLGELLNKYHTYKAAQAQDNQDALRNTMATTSPYAVSTIGAASIDTRHIIYIKHLMDERSVDTVDELLDSIIQETIETTKKEMYKEVEEHFKLQQESRESV